MSEFSTTGAGAVEAGRDLAAENRELRAYLKAFCRATIEPEDDRGGVGVHEANPTIVWTFRHEDEDNLGRGDRYITGGQVRRAMELVGFDKLQIDSPSRTIADELSETAELRRRCEALDRQNTALINAFAALAAHPKDESLERLRELSAKAAAGTWHVDMFPYRDIETGEEQPPQCEGVCTHDDAGGLADSIATCSEREAAFIVAAVNHVRALLSRPSQTAGVAEGYALVPVEPSEDRIHEAVQFALKASLSNDYPWPDYMRDLYRIMTRAAAPKSEVVE